MCETPVIEMRSLSHYLGHNDVDMAEIGHLYLTQEECEAFVRYQTESGTKRSSTRKFDVVLSFAGEDRRYAEHLYNGLVGLGLTCFYDKYDQADLWGKNLYQHLQGIYRDAGMVCIIFISVNYARNLWTKHELEQAQARAFVENIEYILPIKLDATELPGINETVGYLNWHDYTAAQIAEMVKAKIEGIGGGSRHKG